MKEVVINRKTYHVQEDEFESYTHPEYFRLNMYRNVGNLERIAGLIRDISELYETKMRLYITNISSHGGFVKDEVESFVHLGDTGVDILYINSNTLEYELEDSVKYVITTKKLNVLLDWFHCYAIKYFDQYLYVKKEEYGTFMKGFHYYFNEEKKFMYDNLLHYCMIVKNAGDQLRETLLENMPFFDRWTILDTGSTDNTMSIIEEVLVGKKKGRLFQGTFLNFRETRNECLELAGKTNCKYNIMLDDTYRIRGNMREFLELVRDDQFGDSFTMMIQSHDSEYFSNRITKQAYALRYIYKIHEVIQDKDNLQVTLPHDVAYIYDYNNPYMETRTKDRKQLDLKLLDEMVNEDPDNPRHVYYIAQTYSCLENFEKYAEYLEKRVHHPKEGFTQEKLDACFELGRCYEHRLNRPWKLAKKYYKMSYELDTSRPDALYMMAMHYHFIPSKRQKAYDYFRKAFEVGYPVHRQYGLKPTLSFFYLPKFFIMYCFEREEYELAYRVAKTFFDGQVHHSKVLETHEIQSTTEIMQSFFSILHNYMQFLSVKPEEQEETTEEENEEYNVAIVADGGYTPWSGSDILTKGVGGSETWVIEMASALHELGTRVIVFCNTDVSENYGGVWYKSIRHDMPHYLWKNNVKIKHCIISRYSEYILTCRKSPCVENVHFIMHDLGPSGIVFPYNLIKNIYCLSSWHKKYFLEKFSTVPEKNVQVLNYGFRHLLSSNNNASSPRKPYSFIYSSFPNRGLRELLLLWPKIFAKIPSAELHIYSNINHKAMDAGLMNEIRGLLMSNTGKNIYYHGWVNKAQLRDGWQKASFWLYPCTFLETFCMTALEAASNKVCAITNGLGALEDTVGDRGYLIESANIYEKEEEVEKLLDFLVNQKDKQKELVEKNYAWAMSLTWKGQAEKLLESLVLSTLGSNNVSIVPFSSKAMTAASASASASPIIDHGGPVIKKRYWEPLDETRSFCEIFANLNLGNAKKLVLELGPGSRIFSKYVTHSVDLDDYYKITINNIPHERTFLNICYDKLPFANDMFRLSYARHVFEDINNPLFAFEEMVRVSEMGYIETPSLIIEMTRGVDGGPFSHLYKGYNHHYYIVFTDIETNTLVFIPKLPLFEYIDFQSDITKTWDYGNKFLWNNYYIWNKYDVTKQPKIKVYSARDLKLHDTDGLKTFLLDALKKYERSLKYFHSIFTM